MNEKINQIIVDLVQLDPNFAQHRPELEKILMNLLAVKPEPVIDTDFVRRLRVQLLNGLENKPNLSSSWLNIKMNFMKKILVTASVALVVVLAALVGLQKLGVKNNPNKSLLSFGSDVRVSRAADGAFGNLATLSLATTGKGGGSQTAAAAPLGTDAARSSAPVSGMGGGAGFSEKMISPIYEPVNYKYIYKGDDLKLNADKLDVLKKEVPDSAALISGLDSLGLGLVNLNSFPGSKPQSVSFNQDNGYNVYVDFTGGTVSISGYFEAMPMATDAKLCPVDGCPQPKPIKESDIPADSTLIATANQFLSDHGISTAAYGEPLVQNQYRVQNETLMKSNSKALVYWPEYIDVVYPIKIQNDEVYDESGNKMGLNVGVSIRTNKVTSVYNLSTQNYQASSYDAETDASRILKVAAQGGMYGYTGDAAGKTVEIELGTPTVQYVSMWDYQMNSSQQVLVPSLVFPVTKQPSDGSFYRSSVVVPLIKNILDRDNGTGIGGGPVKILNESSTPAVAPRAIK